LAYVKWRDERIAGLPQNRYLPKGEILPTIPADLLKSVVFLGYKDSHSEFKFLGSAFWVARLAVDKFDQPHRLAYLVTAAHNIEKAQKVSADKSVWLRVNIKGNGPQWVAATHTGSFTTSKDKNVDLAILKIPIDETWDNISWPLESLVENDFLDTRTTGDRKVELGDELIFAGLFYPHEGKERNILVVRIGNVAALRGEPVLSRDGRPMDLYLVESHSIGGLSGAPVFIDIRTAKLALPPTAGYMAGAYNPRLWSSFKLFGIVHGHFGIEDILDDAIRPPKRGSKKKGKQERGKQKSEDRINLGISMVIPAEKIKEVVERFVKEEELELEEKAQRKTRFVIQDSTVKANVSFQETSVGFDVPVPTGKQVFGDLRKASRKKD
jgi:hypothetical protein